MHISFLTTEYPHHKTGNGGGIGTSIKNLSYALLELKEQVTVFVISADRDEEFEDNGVHVIKLGKKHYPFATWFFYRKFLQRRINKYIVKNNIDIIEVPDWTGITAFMHLPCPVVMKFHGSDTYFCHLDKRPQKFKNKLLEKIAAQEADAYVGVSKFALDLSFSLLGVNTKKPSAVIYNGINVNQFAVMASTCSEKIILYFGTLIRKKGVLEIPSIFNIIIQEVPDAKLILIGGDSRDIITNSDSTWAMMKECFSENALKNVRYLGKMPYQQMEDYIHKSTICIFPSFAEAFPVSWLEAMSCGKAVVTSNIGWANELVANDVVGYTILPTDHKTYADAIIKLLLNPALCEEFGKKGRKKIEEHFSSSICAKDTVDFYKTLL